MKVAAAPTHHRVAILAVAYIIGFTFAAYWTNGGFGWALVLAGEVAVLYELLTPNYS